MCIAVPMQITGYDQAYAWCEGMGERKRVDTLLIGEQPVGTWVLVFIDSAREVLSFEDAQRISQAIRAVNLAMQGETDVDHLFADLLEREPQLPDFLKKPELKETDS